MKIIKFKKLLKDKYKLFLDNGSSITLYEDVIVNNNLLIKKEIDEELVSDLEKQNNDVYVYGIALNYISIRLRCENEIKEYLFKKKTSLDVIQKVIDRLVREGYINDFNFAKAYCNDQMTLTTSGPLKIKNNLIKFGVNLEIINEVIEEIDNKIVEEKLYNLIEKQLKIKKDSSKMLKIKLLNYFYNLGYEKYMILNELSKFNLKTDITRLQKDYEKLYNKYKNKYEEDKLKYVIASKLYSKGYTSEEIKKIKTEESVNNFV